MSFLNWKKERSFAHSSLYHSFFYEDHRSFSSFRLVLLFYENHIWFKGERRIFRYVCIYINTHIYTHTHIYVYIYTYIHTHTHTHIYVCVYIYISEKAMAPHSSTLVWKIPWTEEPVRLQSMGSLRVGHDWATLLLLFTFMHWRRKWQPTPVFLPGESQGRGSLVGCHLWGRTESEMTEVT